MCKFFWNRNTMFLIKPLTLQEEREDLGKSWHPRSLVRQSVLWSLFALPRRHSGKEFASNIGDAEDVGSIPGSGRSPGVGNGNALQYSLPGKFHRGTWRATVPGVQRIGHNWICTPFALQICAMESCESCVNCWVWESSSHLWN